jgi:DNA-binding HxlR family transcriptional regulator
MRPKPYTCGLEASLELIDGKWKARILWVMLRGTNRFGEMRRHVKGITEKMLTMSLKELESDGVVLRTDFREIPLRVEYSLTPLGLSLIETLIPLNDWGDEHMDYVIALRDDSSTKESLNSSDI